MTLASLPKLGSVVWAELEDANGIRKSRPAVVLTPTDQIEAGKSVRVVAITTRLINPLPDDYVLLPWDRQGKARSGLRRRCAAVASWHAEVPALDLKVVGLLPPNVLKELLNKVPVALRAALGRSGEEEKSPAETSSVPMAPPNNTNKKKSD